MSPGRLDAPLVRRHLIGLETAVRALRSHQGQPADRLRTEIEEAWIVERGLQLCAQNCLDIAIHVAAGAGRDVPDYAAAVDELGRLGVLPRDFAAAFRGIAGFRNILVHGYLAVDLDRLHHLLNERLDDFVEFARHIDAYVSSSHS